MRRKKRPSMDGLVDRSRSRRSAAGAGGGGGSEFFICFTSLSSASSSSMRASAAANAAASSSKSLLSPGRSRDASAAPSLSSSLSRRLRSSGSVKGAQSPMFPLVSGGSRRKGTAFEAAEPSSPKVTCIGQVRVRSKKKKKKKAAAAAAAAAAMRSRSMRGGEASFRRSSTDRLGGGGEAAECLPNKNQRWVYELPVNICDALRNFGSEFSCFFPCGGKSFCSKPSSRSPEGADRGGGRYGGKGAKRSTSSCGGVIARWLMAIEEDEEEDVGRRVDAFSGRIEERRKEDRLEIATAMREEAFGYGYKEFEKDEKKEEVLVVDEAEEEARVSVCVPPPNALLLMRCRSDPVRMAALATRFWDSPAMKVHVEEGHGREKVDSEEEIDVDEIKEKVEEQCAQGHEQSVAEVVDAKVFVTETMIPVDQKERGIAGAIQGTVLVEEVRNVSGGKDSHESELLEKKQSPNEAELNEHSHLHEDDIAGFSEAHRRSSIDQEEVATAPAVKAESPETQGKIEGILITNEVHSVDVEEEEVKGRRSSSYSSTADKEERKSIKCHGKVKDAGRRHGRVFREKDKRRHSFSTDRETRRPSFSNEKEARRASFSIEGKRRWSFCIDSEDLRLEKKTLEEERNKKEHERSLEVKALEKIDSMEAKVTPEEEAEAIKGEECGKELASGEREGNRRNWDPEAQKQMMEKKSNELPDCLLLMMYEPKLSMEVSKETWVCSTDFLRWRPNYRPRQPSKVVSNNGGDSDSASVRGSELANTKLEAKTKSNEEKCSDNKEVIALIEPVPQHSLPPALPVIEKNPKGSVVALQAQVLPPAPAQATTPFGPFVLTRCKSEPMRSSARLTPDACFWKDRHRPIGATGIGF